MCHQNIVFNVGVPPELTITNNRIRKPARVGTIVVWEILGWV